MAELNITALNFETEVLQSDKPVLLDFYANWCGPCKMLAPVLHEIAEENADALKVGNYLHGYASGMAQSRNTTGMTGIHSTGFSFQMNYF